MRTDAERLIDQARDLYDALGRFVDHHEPCERCLPPHDGKPRLRPHTIKGWWQVWSGGICIALLEPEDIKSAGLAPGPAK